MSTFGLLFAENFGGRYKRVQWPAVLAVLEPVGVVLVFSATRSLMAAAPAYGTSDILFFTTGILPFYLFIHVSWRIRSWDTMRRLPRTTEFDLLLSHILGEMVTKISILLICSISFWLLGISDAFPDHPLECLLVLTVIALLGVGVGFVNGVIAGFFLSWLYIYAVLIRFWMAFSGVLFVMDYMPPDFRSFAWYNPLSHAIIWYRVGHYPNFPENSLDREYLLVCTIAFIVIGWLALNTTRRWRPMP